MRVVQLRREDVRRVGIVDGNYLRLLQARGSESLYTIASHALEAGEPLTAVVENAAGDQSLDYEAVYACASDWRLLPSFDYPQEISRCLVSGTGLTHKASAEHRAAMHKQTKEEVTDSIRMYRIGLNGGNPAPGTIGTAPEWFYKGNGSILRAHGECLRIHPYAQDGGEEPEIAGVYLISPEGDPVRIGLTIANEFSDHKLEKSNYLYLAPSKLRECSIGPELTIGEFDFDDVPGTVTVLRNGEVFWSKAVWTGQKNMSHSVRNLEHHHFKYEAHRRPGDVHVHFFGADAFSYGDGLTLVDGDVMEISFPQFGRPLQNSIAISREPEKPVVVRSI